MERTLEEVVVYWPVTLSMERNFDVPYNNRISCQEARGYRECINNYR